MSLSATTDLVSNNAQRETTPSSSSSPSPPVRRSVKMKKKKGKKPLKNGTVDEVLLGPIEPNDNTTDKPDVEGQLLDLAETDISPPSDIMVEKTDEMLSKDQNALEETDGAALAHPAHLIEAGFDRIELQKSEEDTHPSTPSRSEQGQTKHNAPEEPPSAVDLLSAPSTVPVEHGMSSTPAPPLIEESPSAAKAIPPRPEAVPRQKRLSQTRPGVEYTPQTVARPHYPSDSNSPGFHPVADLLESKPRPSNDKHCCRFDSFANSGDTISAIKAKDALLVGCDGGLDVYRVLPDKMEVVGRLEGLGGVVVDAKILPGVQDPRMVPHLPLVAIVRHTTSSVRDGAKSTSLRESNQVNSPTTKIQATVEVFSLRTQKHLSTLFTSLPANVSQASNDNAARPEILGALRIYANGPHIAVASSVSGEVYVFRHTPSDSNGLAFRCIGKLWTTLQESRAVNTPRNASATETNISKEEPLRPQPLVALGHRWLIISCPSSASKLSIQGTPLLQDSQQPLGVGSHNPPIQPAINTEVETVDAEGAVSRLTRHAAQELLKASRKGIEIGLAGWREFTNPSNPSPPQRHANPGHIEADAQAFPPTHAPLDHAQRVEEEPAVLSIIDLEHLATSGPISAKPLAAFTSTFAIEDGCNFMSLSPDGLRLLTTNRTGETSSIWDLRRCFFSSSSTPDHSISIATFGPTIQCVQKMKRSSPCVVVETVWSQSHNEIAMQTTNGTTHLHYLPVKSSRTRRVRSGEHGLGEWSANKSNGASQSSPGTSPPGTYGLLNSIKSGWQSVSTQVNALRQTAPTTMTNTATQPFDISTTLAGLRESANAARVASSRAVARGIASGYSAARTGVGDLWHADENKIRSGSAVEATSLQWIQTTDSMCLGLAHGGKLMVYSIVKATRMRGRTEFIGLKVEKGSKLEYVLPCGSQAATNEVCAHQGPHGFWSLRDPTTTAAPHHNHLQKRGMLHELVQDDVITNPLFCPFHVDPKVSMMVYSDEAETQQKAQSRPANTSLSSRAFWCFGEALLPSIKVNHDSMSMAALVTYDGTTETMIESRVTVHPVSQDIAIQSHRVSDAKQQLMDDDNWSNDGFDD